jgi:hypothetical protein
MDPNSAERYHPTPRKWPKFQCDGCGRAFELSEREEVYNPIDFRRRAFVCQSCCKKYPAIVLFNKMDRNATANAPKE